MALEQVDKLLEKVENKGGDENKDETADNMQLSNPTLIKKQKSQLKQDFLALTEEEQWEKIQKRLNKIFDPKIGIALRDFVNAKQNKMDFQAILDDIIDYDSTDNFSTIVDFFQDKYEWNFKDSDKFVRTMKRVLMERLELKRTASIVDVLNYQQDNDETNNEDDEKKLDITGDFKTKWGDDVVRKLQQYCIEEEYDLETIVEDLDSYEQDNSMLVEELGQQYGWDKQKSQQFVDDLRKIVSLQN